MNCESLSKVDHFNSTFVCFHHNEETVSIWLNLGVWVFGFGCDQTHYSNVKISDNSRSLTGLSTENPGDLIYSSNRMQTPLAGENLSVSH